MPRPVVKPHVSSQPQAAADPLSYRIRLGRFDTREEADTLRERLAQSGFEALVLPTENGFRTQAGAYFSKLKATAVAHRLRKQGFASVIE